MDKYEVLNRWSEYIEERFYDESGKKAQIKKTIEGLKIIKTQVKHTLNKMKPGKATDPDNYIHRNNRKFRGSRHRYVTKFLNEIL